jgi:hypothetical protein
MDDITIVTMLFDLESVESIGRRSLDEYLSYGKSLFSAKLNIIIYTEPKLVDMIKNLNRPDNTKTEIIVCPLEKLPFYIQYYDKIVECRNSMKLIGGSQNKDTPLYTMLTWCKFDLLNRATMKCDSTNLLWVDFGLSHVTSESQFENLDKLKLTEKCKIMSLRPSYPDEIHEGFFRSINGRTGGGLMMFNRYKMGQYYRLFKETINLLLSNGYSPLEEDVLTIIRVSNPDMFDVYFGDYPDLIRNYNDEMYSSVSHLINMINWAKNHNDDKTVNLLKSQFNSNIEYYRNNFDENELKLII